MNESCFWCYYKKHRLKTKNRKHFFGRNISKQNKGLAHAGYLHLNLKTESKKFQKNCSKKTSFKTWLNWWMKIKCCQWTSILSNLDISSGFENSRWITSNTFKKQTMLSGTKRVNLTGESVTFKKFFKKILHFFYILKLFNSLIQDHIILNYCVPITIEPNNSKTGRKHFLAKKHRH